MTIYRRGFTLIELLVVIAIIGILSAVVLASLSQSRNRGNDAAVRSNMNTVKNQIELYYVNQSPNTYNNQAFFSGAASSCTGGAFADGTAQKALVAADANNGSLNVVCAAGGTYYYAAAGLAGGGYYCVDSTGAARVVSGALPTVALANNVCP